MEKLGKSEINVEKVWENVFEICENWVGLRNLAQTPDFILLM